MAWFKAVVCKQSPRFLPVTYAFLSLLGLWSSASADEKIRPRSYQEQLLSPREIFLFQSTYQDHYQVPGARVAWADYPALRRDYPELAGLGENEIDQWILRFAKISKAQLGLRGIRTSDFKVAQEGAATWLHPAHYNRAAVAETPGGELVDLKGTGHKTEKSVQLQVNKFQDIQADPDPARRQQRLQRLYVDDHSDGMASLGEAVAEVVRQRAIQQSFDIYNQDHGTAFQTVESLFIIELPIEITKGFHASDRAAIIGRQPSWRGENLEVPQVKAHIYHDDHGHFQATEMTSAIDFGGVVLANPMLESTFGPPQETLTEKVDVRGVHLIEDAQKSRVWQHSFETAAAYLQAVEQSPQSAREIIQNHIDSKLAPIRQRHQLFERTANSQIEWLKYLITRLYSTRGPSQQRVLKRILEPRNLELLQKHFQDPTLLRMPTDQRATLLVSLSIQANPEVTNLSTKMMSQIDFATLSSIHSLSQNQELHPQLKDAISRLAGLGPRGLRCELIFN